MPPHALWDKEALRQITDGDPRIESELARLFMETAERCLEQLRSLATSGDTEAWRRVLHELKGATANLHAEHMSLLCTEASAAGTTETRQLACASIAQAYGELKSFLDPMARRQE
jgi:HPt (histidine-containing phosphotransfer) domain-containing protein